MEFTLFYAWQNDTPKEINRFFIKNVLKDAIKAIRKDADINDSPRLEHDTKGVPGMPDIMSTIMNKISSAGIFVGDLTFIASSATGKLTPNPNVMFELGYALSELGDTRIVTIINEAYGQTNKLPFDIISRKHPISYTLTEGQQMSSEDRSKIVNQIAEALRLIIKKEPLSKLDPSLRRKVENIIRDSEHEVADMPVSKSERLLATRVPRGLFNLLKDEDAYSACKTADERACIASIIEEYRKYRDVSAELDKYTLENIIQPTIDKQSTLHYRRILAAYSIHRAVGLTEEQALILANAQQVRDNTKLEPDCKRFFEIAKKEAGFIARVESFEAQCLTLHNLSQRVAKAFH